MKSSYSCASAIVLLQVRTSCKFGKGASKEQEGQHNDEDVDDDDGLVQMKKTDIVHSYKNQSGLILQMV